MKNERKKLELLKEFAMHCKVQKLQRREACGKEPDTRRLRYACSSKLTNLRESVRKELCQKIMKIAFPGRGSIH